MDKHILLLEDDALLALTIQELLQSEDYKVTLVSNGAEAADVAYDTQFDLYVFDINVPDMNGLELLEALRGAQDSTPAIFISAAVDLGSISKAFEIGAQDYIKKPFFPEELLIRVNAKLQKHSSSKIIYKDLEFNTSTKILKKGGRVLALGEVQERLLEMFLQNIGQVLDTQILLECLEKPSATALRVAITKLKHTTGLNIRNIRAVGYVLE